jgi:predicted nucleic acid-binding protein
VIFWDASAIVPLVLDEAGSADARTTLERDADMVVWWGTPVEVLSALARAERAHVFAAADVDLARRALEDLGDSWNEVLPSDEVRERAGAGVLRHPLRAADALQLGAALTWARGRPRSHALLSFDARLAEAARQEGFDVIDVPDG